MVLKAGVYKHTFEHPPNLLQTRVLSQTVLNTDLLLRSASHAVWSLPSVRHVTMEGWTTLLGQYGFRFTLTSLTMVDAGLNPSHVPPWRVNNSTHWDLCVSMLGRARHRRIKKQRRHERLAATSHLSPVLTFLTPLAEHFSYLHGPKN